MYIDPGTGGMLFTIIFGLLGGLFYFAGTLLVKLKYTVGGKGKAVDTKKIPIVFFSDHKRYFNTFEPILDEMDRRGIEVKYLTMSEDDPGLTKEYKHITGEFIGTGNKAFSRLNLLNAGIVFCTTPGLDVLMWKRSKNVDYYIHIPHAANDITLYRMFGIDFFDSILLPGEFHGDQVRKMEEMRGLPAKELTVVGVPYLDGMKKRLDAEGAVVEKDKKTVLVAPSWGESGILRRYGSKLIDALLSTGYEIIIRPHPQSFTAEKEYMDELMEKYGESSGVKWNRDNDNFDVLKRADIMISDFSGVVVDFALVFDKPIIYADVSFDAAPYDQAWFEEELWTFKFMREIGLQLSEDQFDHIKDIIDECLSSEKFSAAREKARGECWANIGHSAEKIADYLVEKQEELKKKKEDEAAALSESSKSKKKTKKEADSAEVAK